MSPSLRNGTPHPPIVIIMGKSGKNEISGIPRPGIPHSTIFSALKYGPQLLYLAVFASVFECAKYGQVGYCIPKKILQNVVQMRWI